jgi:CRP-like cAMP-binding protein
MTLIEYAERFGREGAEAVEFDLPRTQEELAAELATTRESVARALGRIRSAGAITQKGSRVRIVDMRLLESIAYTGDKE